MTDPRPKRRIQRRRAVRLRLTMAVSEGRGAVKKRDSTADEVYDWAVEQELPAPDAFAVRYWDLAGAKIRLSLAASIWRRQVRNGTTGFPLVDGDRTDS